MKVLIYVEFTAWQKCFINEYIYHENNLLLLNEQFFDMVLAI